MSSPAIYGIIRYENGRPSGVVAVLLVYESVAAAEKTAREKHLTDYAIAPVEFDLNGEIHPSQSEVATT